MSFTKFLVSFACHIAKLSLRALKKKLKQIGAYGQKCKKNKTKKPTKKQKKQQIEKLLTISVVFPSCDQIQPMDGLFYTKDEVAPYCSPEDRSCFSFLLKILFDLHGRTSSYFVVCLNYLPLVFYILQKKKKKFFCFVLYICLQQKLAPAVFSSFSMKSSGYQLIEKMALNSMSFSGSLLALLNSETYIDGHQ